MDAIDWVTRAMDSKDEAFFKALGARLAEARKAQGLTQIELAQRLAIPQQTLARYEVGRSRLPISLLLTMARMLNFSLDDMLMGVPAGRAKRGPASRLERQIEALSRLPKARQKFVVDMLDAVLAQQQRA